MSEFESFYGGRQGASIVIVKKFDGLDIPNKKVYKVRWFAQDENYKFIVPLVERNANNFTNYYKWDTIPCDGTTTVTSADGLTSDPLPVQYAEGMKQCFEQGGMTASEVGYGEYVLIDTINGLGQYNNPDNGKVYRRGMNYDDDLGGAEYIGQIVGPQGDAPTVDMGTIEQIQQFPQSFIRTYDMTEGDKKNGIVPGKYIKEGSTYYNDKITYGWARIRDVHGNITGALIGFVFPYLVSEIESKQRSPYYTQEDFDLGRITDESLIGTSIKDNDNFGLFIDNGFESEDRDPTHGDTGHAFYRKWKVTIPRGIKGDAQTQLEIVPTKIREKARLWDNPQLVGEPVALADARTYVVLTDDPFDIDCVYPYDNESKSVKARKELDPSAIYYSSIVDTYMLKLRYRQTNYNEYEDGSDYSIVDLGDYNSIRKVWLAEDGYLWVRYNAEEDGIVNSNDPIQWIEEVDTDKEGNVIFTYNTLDEEGRNTQKKLIKKIDWVNSVALANRDNPAVFDPMSGEIKSGHFRIIFNNDSVANKTGTWRDDDGINHAVWETDITWPQSVSLEEDGLLKFLYNNNLYYDKAIYTDEEEGSYKFILPWITKVMIQQNGKFDITFNNNKNKDNYEDGEWDEETHTWSTVLNFIDHVTIDEDGHIHFWYSNGTEASNEQYANITIKYLTDTKVDTGLKEDSQYDFDGEGTGDQKIHLMWNTESQEEGKKDEDVIGAPINYIMETLVTTYDSNSPNTPQNHLLVLYSDPIYRQWLIDHYKTNDPVTNKIWKYTSKKFTQEDPTNPGQTTFITRDDWFDLGYVKGEPGGLHIIGQYTLADGETYRDYLTDGVPPEAMPGNTPEERGWAYLITSEGEDGSFTRTIYTYDYIHDKWEIVSSFDSTLVDPTQSIILDATMIDPVTSSIKPESEYYINAPHDYGIWLVRTNLKSVY